MIPNCGRPCLITWPVFLDWTFKTLVPVLVTLCSTVQLEIWSCHRFWMIDRRSWLMQTCWHGCWRHESLLLWRFAPNSKLEKKRDEQTGTERYLWIDTESLVNQNSISIFVFIESFSSQTNRRDFMLEYNIIKHIFIRFNLLPNWTAMKRYCVKYEYEKYEYIVSQKWQWKRAYFMK